MFYFERFNGRRWTALRVCNVPQAPSDFQGPQESFPASETPSNAGVLAGLPGWKCRLTFDGDLLEEWEWDRVPLNPLDPDSDRKWGWKSVSRNYKPTPNDHGVLSVLG